MSSTFPAVPSSLPGIIAGLMVEFLNQYRQKRSRPETSHEDFAFRNLLGFPTEEVTGRLANLQSLEGLRVYLDMEVEDQNRTSLTGRLPMVIRVLELPTHFRNYTGYENWYFMVGGIVFTLDNGYHRTVVLAWNNREEKGFLYTEETSDLDF